MTNEETTLDRTASHTARPCSDSTAYKRAESGTPSVTPVTATNDPEPPPSLFVRAGATRTRVWYAARRGARYTGNTNTER